MTVSSDSNTQSVTIAVTTSSQSSPVFYINEIAKAAIQWVYTSGAGTGSLFVSNDGNNFSEIMSSSLTFSGDDSAVWDVVDTSCKYVKIVFASGSGMEGTLIFNTKGL